jgi:hypothetical protein
MKNIIKETKDVLLVNTSTLGFVSFSDVELVLKLILLILSIVYTLDKIISNRRKK